jgi:hypothetical protein
MASEGLASIRRQNGFDRSRHRLHFAPVMASIGEAEGFVPRP